MLNRQCWDSSTWLTEVSAWLYTKLNQLNAQPIGPLQQVSGWALGQILKQTTNKGDFYFKATAFLPTFSNEAQLCQLLSSLFPQTTPEVIAIDANKQWMLTANFGATLPENTPLSVWSKVFSQYSKMQIASIPHTDNLKKNGCLHRPIVQLPEQLEHIFNILSTTEILTDEIFNAATPIIQAVRESIVKISKYSIPETLVHGDLHIENVAAKDNSFVFFDWSDACVSHPFIDGTYIYRMPDTQEKQHIIETYLSQWNTYLAFDALMVAWNTAEIICYAHQAVSYASIISNVSKQGKADLQTAFLNAFKRLNKKALTQSIS